MDEPAKLSAAAATGATAAVRYAAKVRMVLDWRNGAW